MTDDYIPDDERVIITEGWVREVEGRLNALEAQVRGCTDGFSDGYTKGFAKGRASGLLEGYSNGHAEAIAEGCKGTS